MRFMVMVKATPESENLQYTPEQMEQMFTEMGAFNQELIDAGVMVSGEGLLPSSQGKRIRFSGTNRTVIDGPFAETKELVAGFWIINVPSLEDAVNWMKRCPNPTGEEGELEIRQIGEAEDMGEAYTPELRAQEERQRAQIEEQQSKQWQKRRQA